MVSILLGRLEKLQLPQQIANCCAGILNFYYPFRIQDDGIATCPEPRGIRDCKKNHGTMNDLLNIVPCGQPAGNAGGGFGPPGRAPIRLVASACLSAETCRGLQISKLPDS